MIYLTWLSYFLYIAALFYYVNKIFGTTNINLFTYTLYCICNSFLVFLPIYISNFNFEWLQVIIYFCVFAVQIHIACKQPLISTFAATLCFTINYFGTRVFLIGLLSYNKNLQITDFLANIDNRTLITFMTFTFLAPYIMISSLILIHKVVRYLFADMASLKLCCFLLFAVLINQTLSLETLYSNVNNTNFNSIYQMRTGLFALISFVLIMVAVFIYSKLKEAEIIYEDTSLEIETENITIHKLESEVITDFFTGFFIRSVAIDKLKSLLFNKSYCYVLFIDLDGLKTVNDTHGHEEGDFYIKNAAEIISDVFSSDTISRIGGDEFLIIGNNKISPITKKVLDCYNRVLNLNKNYETSISYGFVEVDEHNTLSHEELIDLADKEMYAFKKGRNKQRKVRDINFYN